MFELKHLRALVAIREAGSMALAAKSLHVTLSALSHSMKELERLLDVPLLVRKEKPLRFTRAGLRLLELADQILPEVELAQQDLARMSEGSNGRLLLAMECHSCFDWLMPTLDAYRASWKDVELDLRIGTPFDVYPALRSGAVDLVVTSDPVSEPDVAFEPLFRYEIVLVCPPDDELVARAWVTPDDVAESPFITYPVPAERLDFFRRFLHPAGVFPSELRHAELTMMIVQLVASGHGLAALPSWAVAGDAERGTVRTVRVGEDGLWCDLYAAVRSSQRDEPYVAAFLAEARRSSFRTLRGILPLEPRELA